MPRREWLIAAGIIPAVVGGGAGKLRSFEEFSWGDALLTSSLGWLVSILLAFCLASIVTFVRSIRSSAAGRGSTRQASPPPSSPFSSEEEGAVPK